MWDLLRSRHYSDLVESPDLRREASVYAQDFAINHCRQREEVEDLTARLPDRSVAVLLLALLVESVHLRDLSRFVVPAHERDLVGISARTVSVPRGNAQPHP